MITAEIMQALNYYLFFIISGSFVYKYVCNIGKLDYGQINEIMTPEIMQILICYLFLVISESSFIITSVTLKETRILIMAETNANFDLSFIFSYFREFRT